MAPALVPAWASPTGTMLDAAGGSCLAGGACMVSQATWECAAPNSSRQHCTMLVAGKQTTLRQHSHLSAAHAACPPCETPACHAQAQSVMHGWHDSLPDPLGGPHFAGSLHS